jgi:hypothetical protein
MKEQQPKRMVERPVHIAAKSLIFGSDGARKYLAICRCGWSFESADEKTLDDEAAKHTTRAPDA